MNKMKIPEGSKKKGSQARCRAKSAGRENVCIIYKKRERERR